ncbi:NADPH2:quinone reductase [Lipingzhangella halophila]|uniref:NADPH2:quinone reductase n=1 Tax=Lipingzhangella halophila TaxID=1783352 RepID=A0A7W7RK43_9ACTN|nr:zinc-binding dehydrogenase [Lipingzhangella halophila]MBB4933411.1 NADPH2:quinone reductase [Lipingzhangella halophila]
MRAVQVRKFGDPEVLEPTEVPDPAAGPGEVVVEAVAADVLYLDTLLRSGWGTDYFPIEPPYVPGSGISGRVAAVGDGVDADLVGTRVLTETGEIDPETGRTAGPTGGYAERAAVPVTSLIPLPDGAGPQEALVTLHDGPLALMVSDAAPVEADSWVLVAAAAGGGGSLLVQLARAAGARVIGAARGQRKLEFVREQGAEFAVDYSEPDWQERVRRITGGHGPAVVYDGAGGELGRQAFEAVADGGRMVSYGSGSGSFADVDPAEAERRGVRVTGLLDLPAETGDSRRRLVARALELVAAGRITPVIGQTFELDRASEAHAALEGRTTVGKTLLAI